jgi:hypothetical protein
MTDQTESEILRVTRQFRAALERQDAAALQRLTQSYQQLYSRLKDKIDLLAIAIGEEEPTAGQLVRMTRYKSLIRQVEQELTDFQVILRNEIGNTTNDAIRFAGRDVYRALRVAGSTYGVELGFNRLPAEAIKSLLGFLQPESPLYKRIGELAGYNTEFVAQKLVEGIGLGYNPRKVAALIRDSLGGGLTDALRMTRTAQLWSYREATRANYLANADVVEGWVWWAHLAGEPCMACIAEHGSIHDLSETLDDHYNGRCTQIPVVRGFPSPVEQTGEAWFSGLDEAKQKELMGEGKYESWKGGKFEFSQLAGKHTDAVYGSMTVESTLQDLLGNE